MGWRWLRSARRRPRPEAITATLRCDRCGVVLAPEEAQQTAGRYYCPEHAQSD
jgi:formylmethanofuran dehydrogenase subunit E